MDSTVGDYQLFGFPVLNITGVLKVINNGELPAKEAKIVLCYFQNGFYTLLSI